MANPSLFADAGLHSPNMPPVGLKGDRQEVWTELQKLEQDQARLDQKKRELLNRWNAYAAAHSLPDECLAMIFLRVVEEEHEALVQKDTRAFHLGISQRIAATTVAAVCARWRAVALSTPLLWACIFARLGRYPQGIERFLDGFLQRLERAKAVPLYLELGTHSMMRRSPDKQVPGLVQAELDIVGSILPRCRSFTLDLPWRDDPRTSFSKLLFSEMPDLEVLVLRDRDAPAKKIPIPLRLKKLRTLDLRNIDLRLVTPSHLTELTTLKVISSSISTIPIELDENEVNILRSKWIAFEPDAELCNYIPLRTLQYSTKLKSLTLANVALTTSEDDLPTVTFPDLEDAELLLGNLDEYEDEDEDEPDSLDETPSGQSMLNILRRIKMPALRSLAFSELSVNGLSCKTIFDTLARNQPPLEELILQRFTFDTPDLLNLLSQLPRLTTLRLEELCISRGILEGMKAQEPPNETRCPALNHLTIKGTRTANYSIDDYKAYAMTALRSMVRSRKLAAHVSSISHLIVEDHHLRIQKETRDQFREFVEHLELNKEGHLPPRDHIVYGASSDELSAGYSSDDAAVNSSPSPRGHQYNSSDGGGFNSSDEGGWNPGPLADWL